MNHFEKTEEQMRKVEELFRKDPQYQLYVLSVLLLMCEVLLYGMAFSLNPGGTGDLTVVLIALVIISFITGKAERWLYELAQLYRVEFFGKHLIIFGSPILGMVLSVFAEPEMDSSAVMGWLFRISIPCFIIVAAIICVTNYCCRRFASQDDV